MFGTAGTALALSAAYIIDMRDKRKAALAGKDEGDFIDGFINAKKKAIASKPWGMSVKSYAAVALVSGGVLAATGFALTGRYLAGVCLFAVGLFVPEVVQAVREQSWRNKFEERYARGLRQLSASLKAGLSIQQAVTDLTVCPFIHDSVRLEYQQLDADLKVGVSVEEGFKRYYERVHCDDAHDVAIAISMQNETGGNEARVIETIARDIGDRIMNRKEIKSLFSGTSITITMMDVIPLGIIAFLTMFSPEYMAPFFESFFMTCVFVGLIGFTLIGSVVIRRLVKKMKDDCGV
jgi:tight adherence protein B